MDVAPKAGSHQVSGLEKTITVVRAEGSLGMTVSALRDGSGMIIRSVANGGAISKDGRLGVGDGIVSINGEATIHLTNAQARAMLRRHSLTGPDLSLTYVPAAFLDMHQATIMQSKQDTIANRANVIELKAESEMDQTSAAQSSLPLDTALRKLGRISEPTRVDGGRVKGSSLREMETEQTVSQAPEGHRPDEAWNLGKGGAVRGRISLQQSDRLNGAAKELGNENMNQAQPQKHSVSWGYRSSRVTLIRTNRESLGISIIGGRGMGSRLSNGEVRRGIFIKHIAEDSPAARNNTLKAGDQILQVGGVDVSTFTHEEAVEAIRQAGDKVQLLVQHQQVSDAVTRHKEHLSQTKNENRLEDENPRSPVLCLSPAYPATPIPFKPTESRLLRKPPQAVLPPLRLSSGPVGTVTDGVTTKNVFERRSGPPETTQHSGQEQASYWNHILERYGNLSGELKMVELDCSTHSSGLGVCVTESRKAAHGRISVYVSEVQQDGVAAADGRIRVGDELLEINGQILYGHSHQNATDIISSAQPKAVIVLMRNKMALRHMASGPDMEIDSSGILSPSAVDIGMIKEGQHDSLLNQKGSARLEDKQNISDPISFNTSTNHKLPTDPVLPSFYSSSPSHIYSSSRLTTPTSHNTAAKHIHHAPSLCNSLANHCGFGLPSTSCCPSCSRCCELLTRPIIPGCLNTIDICKGPSGLGLTVVGGCNTLLGAIMIQEVNEDGAACRDGRLMAGDHILEVNGIDLRMATHEEALSVLRLSAHFVRLCVYRHPCAHTTHSFQNRAPHIQEDMWDLFTVDLHIDPKQDLGLNIVGKRNDIGIFVSEIMKGGVVDLDGRLLPGDQILSVNGEDIRAVTQDYARTLLQNCRGSAVLEMARFKSNPHYSYECLVSESHTSPLPSVNIYEAVEGNVGIKTVTFEKGSCDSLGLHASADAGLKKEAGLYTSAMDPVRAAAHAELLEVTPHSKDGRSASRRSSSELPEIFNTQGHLSSQYQTISLESGSVGLGISIAGGLRSSYGNQPIYIKNVFPKGATAKDSRLWPGHQLLAVNGRSLQGVMHTDTVAILRQASSSVTLTVLSHTHPPPAYDLSLSHTHTLTHTRTHSHTPLSDRKFKRHLIE